jgi:hypothetical protein
MDDRHVQLQRARVVRHRPVELAERVQSAARGREGLERERERERERASERERERESQ